MRLPTHSSYLERWLGADQAEHISSQFAGWYGPPVAVRGVPGAVFVGPGGDFVGPIAAGRASNLMDFAAGRARSAVRRWAHRSQYTMGMGFSSLGDLISEATNGKKRTFTYQKASIAGVTAGAQSTWRVGNQPVAGSAAAAAPGGEAPTDATVGAFPFVNPTSPDTQHLVRWEGSSNQAGTALLLYDRIFAVAKTMSSTATEAVTGTPTRYQATSGADYAAGNFLFMEVGTTLGNTAHNWTVCTYTDQDGNTGATLPSLAGVNACSAPRLDMPLSTWFAPLASGDTGIKALTQMQCSASVTGAVDFVIGHPLAVLPGNAANYWFVLPMINDAFSLERVFDDACLALLELPKPVVGAATYNGTFQTVSG